MNNMRIFIDIDDTSAETITDWVFCHVNKKYWTNYTFETTENYSDVFWKILNLDWTPMTKDEKIQLFNSSILLDQGKNEIRAVEWSVKKILEWWEKIDQFMITARHWMLKEYTPEWVEFNYGSNIRKVLFSNSYHWWKVTKSEICDKYWITIGIEDSMDEAYHLAKDWIHTFLLRKPWNEQRKEKHPKINRVDSWDDIKL